MFVSVASGLITENSDSLGLLGLSLLLFVIRDLCIILYCHLKAPSVSRGDFSAIFYVFVIYFFLPLIYTAMFDSVTAKALFFPSASLQQALTSIVASSLQVGLAFYSLLYYLRNKIREVEKF